MRWGNIILGALGLALLQGVVSGAGAKNLGGFLAGAGKAVEWFVDPTVPAFSNTSTPSTSSQSAVATYTPATTATTPISPTQGQLPAGTVIGPANPSTQTLLQGGAV